MGSRAIWLKEVKQLQKSVREIFCCAEQKHFLHLWSCDPEIAGLSPMSWGEIRKTLQTGQIVYP
jgi:hypothetical protein